MRTELLKRIILYLTLILAGCSKIDTPIQEFAPFIRIDRNQATDYDKELENLRIITKDKYKFHNTNKRYEIPSDYQPNETGLDTLNISASAQFNGRQFRELVDELHTIAGDKEIYVIDLRRESHGFMNDLPFSIYEFHNLSNLELSADEIMTNEETYFSSLVGKTIKAYTVIDGYRGKEYTYEIKNYMSERELVESEGFHYVRLPIKDNHWPDAEAIDQFINLVKEVGFDNIWIHFHCSAGEGRTGAFMVIYDKMKNPDVPIEEIAIRQTLLGASYMLYVPTNSNNWMTPLFEEKKKMTYLFEEYVAENKNTNYEMSWSKWLKSTTFLQSTYN